jgi:hypothetical protein
VSEGEDHSDKIKLRPIRKQNTLLKSEVAARGVGGIGLDSFRREARGQQIVTFELLRLVLMLRIVYVRCHVLGSGKASTAISFRDNTLILLLHNFNLDSEFLLTLPPLHHASTNTNTHCTSTLGPVRRTNRLSQHY